MTGLPGTYPEGTLHLSRRVAGLVAPATPSWSGSRQCNANDYRVQKYPGINKEEI